MRVLVVEHDPVVRHFLDRALTREGYHVLTAPTPPEADALLLDFPDEPHIALIDLRIAGISLHYGKALRDRFRLIRIVFMTTAPGQGLHREAEGHGAVLAKPFTPGELFAVINPPPSSGRQVKGLPR